MGRVSCARCATDLGPAEARAGVHATFGLLNSTPHSAFLPPEEMRALLSSMAQKALGVTESSALAPAS